MVQTSHDLASQPSVGPPLPSAPTCPHERAYLHSPEPGDLYTPQVKPVHPPPDDEEDPPYPELDRLPITFTALKARSTFSDPHSGHSRPSPSE